MDIFSILAVAVSLYILYYVIGAVLAVGFIFCFYFAVKKLDKIIKKRDEKNGIKI